MEQLYISPLPIALRFRLLHELQQSWVHPCILIPRPVLSLPCADHLCWGLRGWQNMSHRAHVQQSLRREHTSYHRWVTRLGRGGAHTSPCQLQEDSSSSSFNITRSSSTSTRTLQQWPAAPANAFSRSCCSSTATAAPEVTGHRPKTCFASRIHEHQQLTEDCMPLCPALIALKKIHTKR